MEESIFNIKEELKRADHLLYVSLKYTRTVDVLRSIIERLINAFDFGIEALLVHAKEKKKIHEIPHAPTKKIEKILEVYPMLPNIKDFMDFYALLRKIRRAEFSKAREFRRHVTMTVTVEGKVIEVNIDLIHEYFDKTKEFLSLVEKTNGGKEND